MAGDKTLKLSIWIAGRMDKSLTAAINSANGQVSSLSRNISRMGTVGLAAMGALAGGTVAALADCTKEAVKYQNALGDVIKYVDGIADTQGRIGKNAKGTADNGKTYAENYQTVYDAILNVATVVPMAKEELAELTALMGQSGKTIEQMFTFDGKNVTGGLVKDAAIMAAAWDIGAKEAADYGAKWENSFRMNHDEVMELANQINYLGAHSATTAAEIASAVNQAASLGQLAGFDPSTVAAMADAMLATGVSSDRVGTSIKRMALNLSKGSDMTKKQKAVLAEMGLTAQQVAKGLNSDNIGTMNRLFEGIAKLPKERRLNAVGQLFGIWAAEGGAKIVNNLDVYQKALDMVGDEAAYMNSMQREFDIRSATPEAVRQMRDSAIELFKVNVGENFLPVRAQMDEAVRQFFLQLNDTLPELSALAAQAAKALSDNITDAGGKIQDAMPYIKDALDYLVNNGDKVIKVLEGIGGAFLGMKFAPQIEGAARGIGTLLTGKGGMGSLLAGGAGQEKGRKLGGLLGGVKNLFTGGQSAVAAGAGAISAFSGAAGSNGLRATLGAMLSSLISGNGLRGTTGLLQAAAGTPGLLSGYQSIGSILGGTRAGQYLGGIGSSLGNLGGVIGGTKPGQFLGGLLNRAGGFIGGKAAAAKSGISGLLNAATLPLRKGIAGIGASAIINGNILANSKGGQLAGGLLRGGAGLMGSIWGPVAGGFGSLFAGAVPVVGAISGIIAVVSILGDHLEDIRGIVGNVFGEKGLAIFDTFTDKIKGVGQFISGLFQEGGVAKALAPLREMFSGALGKGGLLSTIFGGQEGGLAAFDGVVQIIQSVMGVVGQLVSFSTQTVKPIIEQAFGFITQTVLPTIVSMFSAAAPTIASIISGIGSAVMTGMQIIGSAIQFAMPIIGAIIQLILNVGSVAIPAVLSAFSAFAQGVSGLMENIKGIFDGLISFITGVFTGNWSKAWDGIKQVFGNAFDALITLCKTPINAVISLINKAIEGINGLGLDIPEWVPLLGGKKFSINIPEIDMLARGGFTAGPSIAGEAGREAVISFMPSERARNVALWEQAGRMLGVNSIQLDEIGPVRNEPTGGGSITYAPQITIQGNADREVIDEALREAQDRFEAWYEQMMRQRARMAY